MHLRSILRGVLLTALIIAPLTSCSTAPKTENREDFVARATSSTAWFKRSVPGLEAQIDGSAGYIIFPDVSQFGILLGGSTNGRGALYTPSGSQVGWAAFNNASFGLQAGVQGFRMLIVFENRTVLNQFKQNKLTGGAAAIAVGGDAGGSGVATFTNGMAIYQGANEGLMAGIQVQADYLRYVPLGQEDS